MPRKIDKQIEDVWKRERRGEADGNRAMSFAARIESRALQRSKKELVAGGDLPNTPVMRKPPRPKKLRV